MNNYHLNTTCIQGGYEPKEGEPRVLPIVQSTTFKYESAETVGKLFDLQESGFFYTRLANPTLDAVEKKIAALEGGVGAMLTSSGQAAITIAMLNLCKAGDHVISSSAIYGGTFNLFNKTFRDLGIDITFVTPDITAEQLMASFKSNTKAVYVESISNPSLDIIDVEMFSKIAHQNDVPVIVDNTFPTPVNFKPFEYGADIVVHSTSKYLDGHAVSLGGVIVDSGKFNFANGKFPAFTEPDESYHGIIYSEAFGNAAYISKARLHLMRDIGAQQSPQNAFLLNLGLETLFLRVERHCKNAQQVAEFLENHPKIEFVTYPGLKSNKYYNIAQKYYPNGTCGVITFGVKGDKETCQKLIDNLKLIAMVVHVADARSGILHPASTTHRQLSDKQLVEAGIKANSIRLSVGIEYVDDIINDLKQALDKI
ncbi:MAG: aminotransferase class V-fold PLP-dependent enzyme [Bacillota bacterium]|nr:aminotransferase class V-fold PLP-dependent enzyme [Bacillota bacterium]